MGAADAGALPCAAPGELPADAGDEAGDPGATVLCEIPPAALDFVNEQRWAFDLYEIVRRHPDLERFSPTATLATILG